MVRFIFLPIRQSSRPLRRLNWLCPRQYRWLRPLRHRSGYCLIDDGSSSARLKAYSNIMAAERMVATLVGNIFAGRLRVRAVNRFENRGGDADSRWEASPERTYNYAGLVGEISPNIFSVHHVEILRPLNNLHGGIVHKHILGGNIDSWGPSPVQFLSKGASSPAHWLYRLPSVFCCVSVQIRSPVSGFVPPLHGCKCRYRKRYCHCPCALSLQNRCLR